MGRKKKIIVLAVCTILLLALSGGTFAWYLREDAKRAQTEAAAVMAPYNLYLMDENAKDTLQFAVGNLHPGEVKTEIICVSNKRPDNYTGDDSDMAEQAKDSEFGYDLMLVHTDNLAVNYTVYALKREQMKPGVDLPEGAVLMEDGYYGIKGDPLEGNENEISKDMRQKVFGSQDISGIVNVGTYWLSTDDEMNLKYVASEKKYDFEYYLIEISWKDIRNFDVYKKETDLVYVVVNAKQPRPVEKAAGTP